MSMSQADSTLTTGVPGDDPGHLLSLARQNAARAYTLQSLQRLRRAAREEISRLIAFLDQSDPYVMSELEDEDDREPVGDEEPSLGSLDRAIDQSRWSRGNQWDIDAELDTADDEPSLAAAEHHPMTPWSGMANRPGEVRDMSGNQTFWGISGPTDDREDDAGDNRE